MEDTWDTRLRDSGWKKRKYLNTDSSRPFFFILLLFWHFYNHPFFSITKFNSFYMINRLIFFVCFSPLNIIWSIYELLWLCTRTDNNEKKKSVNRVEILSQKRIWHSSTGGRREKKGKILPGPDFSSTLKTLNLDLLFISTYFLYFILFVKFTIC